MPANLGNDPEFNDVTPKSKSGRSISLIELLVVLGIIALLIALLLPASRSSRGFARRSQCINNLKQIVLALANYEEAHGVLPPAYTVDAAGRPLHSWRTLILPYLNEDALYRSIDLSKPWDDPANAKALQSAPPAFYCPGATGPRDTTTYLAIVGPGNSFLPREGRRLAEITDDPGSTILVIEAGADQAVPWMAPRDADEALVMGLGPTSKFNHAGGMNAALVDGSVRFLPATTTAPVRRALLSISGHDEADLKGW